MNPILSDKERQARTELRKARNAKREEILAGQSAHVDKTVAWIARSVIALEANPENSFAKRDLESAKSHLCFIMELAHREGTADTLKRMK
tara:strand:+ start:475 stop:744 length:270 start_codon:yes stop_codon:yes gene_type:complete